MQPLAVVSGLPRYSNRVRVGPKGQLIREGPAVGRSGDRVSSRLYAPWLNSPRSARGRPSRERPPPGPPIRPEDASDEQPPALTRGSIPRERSANGGAEATVEPHARSASPLAGWSRRRVRRRRRSPAACTPSCCRISGAAPRSAAAGGAPAVRTGKRAFEVKAVSSANGLEATRLAHQRITAGDDALDAAIAGVNLVEDDPEDTHRRPRRPAQRGRGGRARRRGDARPHPPCRGGGLAARHPQPVPGGAEGPREETDHVLLVGRGCPTTSPAPRASAEEELLTEKARKIWLYWKQSLSDRDDWEPPPDRRARPGGDREFFGLDERPAGTIHLRRDRRARATSSCVTTTSGLAFKIPGRVGDSPILGAGLYCRERGRELRLDRPRRGQPPEPLQLRRGGADARRDVGPKDAGLEVLRRVAKTSEPRLRDERGASAVRPQVLPDQRQPAASTPGSRCGGRPSTRSPTPAAPATRTARCSTSATTESPRRPTADHLKPRYVPSRN